MLTSRQCATWMRSEGPTPISVIDNYHWSTQLRIPQLTTEPYSFNKYTLCIHNKCAMFAMPTAQHSVQGEKNQCKYRDSERSRVADEQ